MLTAQGQVAGIMVTGIDPKYEKNVSIIQNHIVAGSLDSLKRVSSVLCLVKTWPIHLVYV